MGLAASQARLLVLTARKSDLEYRAQNITNRKLLLAMQTENIAMDYTRALSNRQLRFVFDYNSNDMQDINELLTVDSVYAQNSAFIGTYRVVLADGRIAVPDASYIPYNVRTNSEGRYESGMVSGLTDSEIIAKYNNLSEQQKIGYLAEALGALTEAYTAKALTAEQIAAFGLENQVTAEGNPLISRQTALQNLITKAYGEGTTADVSKLTDAEKATIKAIATSVSSTVPEGVKSTISAEGTADEYAAALGKIKTYLDANATGNDWLNKYVNSNVTSENILNDASAGSMKYAEYISNLVKAYKPTEDVNSDNYKALANYLANDSNAMGLIINNSSFASQLVAEGSKAYVTAINNKDGSQNVTVLADDGTEYVILPALKNAEFFQNALREGSILLQKFTQDKGNGTGAWTNENWAASSIIQDKLYTEDDALAEAEYETQTAIIQSQDKMLDVELKQIETQQKACENEIESVKKILDKNVEKACKYMS